MLEAPNGRTASRVLHLGTLVFGERRQLTHDFLKAGTPLFVGAGSQGRRVLLAGIAVIQVAEVCDLTSQGHNISQHIGGIHAYRIP